MKSPTLLPSSSEVSYLTYSADEKNTGDVKPEVYMISDQGQALERHNLFVDSSNRKLVKVKVAQKY